MSENLTYLIPEIFLCISAVFLLIVGVIGGNKKTNLLLSATIITLIVTIYMLISSIGNVSLFNGGFILNNFIIFSKALMLFGSILTMFLTRDWLQDHQRFEYPILILFANLGLMIMLSSGNFLSLYMGLELSSLSLYILAAFANNRKSSEAGLKYFVLGSLSSGLLLFGISLIYGFTGTINFSEIVQVISSIPTENGIITSTSQGLPYGIIFALILILSGFLFKISAAPFHMWAIDVYQGSPTPVTVFFATAPKIAALLMLTRITGEIFVNFNGYTQQILVVIAFISMIFGAFGALTQTNIKRLLAYSSVGHIGFMLAAISTNSKLGMEAMILYLILYLFMVVGAFGCILLLKRKGEYLENLSDLAGISKNNPWFAMSFTILMLSMAGIPPLAGFFGKMYVFMALIENNMIILATIAILTSVVSAFYYLKLVKIMYFDDPCERLKNNQPLSIKLTIFICVIIILFFFLMPESITDITKIVING